MLYVLQQPLVYNEDGEIHVMAVDCGIKYNQIRCLCSRGAKVTVVPWDYELNSKGNLFTRSHLFKRFYAFYVINQMLLYFPYHKDIIFKNYIISVDKSRS